MKKIYNAPLTEVVKINIEQMICNSPNAEIVDGDANGDGMGKVENPFFDSDLW